MAKSKGTPSKGTTINLKKLKKHLLKKLTIENPQSKCLLVCQTTLSFPKVLESYSILKDKYPQLEISNQICNATFNRDWYAFG